MGDAPAWRPGRALYHLHSLGAAGGRGFGALAAWLDHVADLGFGGILLTPIFASTSHGYDTVDPLRIDPRLGDDDAFDAFVAASHERDLHVILDAVLNHVGTDFPRFADALANPEGSPWREWFGISPDATSYRTFEGHRELPALRHENPEVLDWAVEIVTHWLGRGVDGWRFDAAYAIPRAFLTQVTAAIRARRPDALLFGEIIHGDYSGFVSETGMTSATQYELHKAIWSAVHDANLFELEWALRRHDDFCGTFPPITFAGNHDVTRLASQLTDPDDVEAATAILLTVPGIPTVYYGDELGWTGVKERRAGGDDAIRPPLPHAPPATSRLTDVHRELIAFRREHAWLTTGRVHVTDVANRRLAFTCTADDGGRSVEVRVDLAATPRWTIERG